MLSHGWIGKVVRALLGPDMRSRERGTDRLGSLSDASEITENALTEPEVERQAVVIMSTVYIETSVVSYYTSRPSRDLVTAARQQITREWWETNRLGFETYISTLVLEEAGEGDQLAAEKRLQALAGMPVLTITNEVETLVAAFIQLGPIPEEYVEDALHIAVAAVNGMDFLLTWNFTHINNAVMKRALIQITEQNGYECPIICSPDELGREEA